MYHAGTSHGELALFFRTDPATISFWKLEDGWNPGLRRLARTALEVGHLREMFESGASWPALREASRQGDAAMMNAARRLGWDLNLREANLKRIVSGGHDSGTLSRMRTRRHKHAKRSASTGDVTGRAMASLLAENPLCTYCAAPIREEERSLDHIEPLSRGGLHSLSNLAVCCFACNSSKRDRPLLVWLASRRAA